MSSLSRSPRVEFVKLEGGGRKGGLREIDEVPVVGEEDHLHLLPEVRQHLQRRGRPRVVE
jgi:hypothetical protein